MTSVFPRWEGDETPPFVLRQAEAVASAGWRVTVLAPHAKGAQRDERIGDIEVIRFGYLWPAALQGLFYDGGMLVQLRKHPHRKWQLPFFLMAQILAARKLCAAKHFDVLHAHSLLPQGFTALYNGRLPVVATSHGNDVFGLKRGGLYDRLKRKVVREVAAVTANSSVTEAALIELGAPPERVHRVPATPNIAPSSQVEVARIRAEYPAGSKLVVFVGRLIEQKGVGDLIQAVAQLRTADVHLLIIGDGADRSRFEQMASAAGLDKRVKFLGWQSRETLANYLEAADVFAGPSKMGPRGSVEAQGLVFVEAMAAAAPIVATRSGGIPDMIVDGETGLLTEPGEPKLLAGKIDRILMDRDLARKLADGALMRYRVIFSAETVTREILNVYRSVLR